MQRLKQANVKHEDWTRETAGLAGSLQSHLTSTQTEMCKHCVFSNMLKLCHGKQHQGTDTTDVACLICTFNDG